MKNWGTIAALMSLFLVARVFASDDDDWEEFEDDVGGESSLGAMIDDGSMVGRFSVIDRKDYTVEMICLTAVFLYIVCFLAGRSKNSSIAYAWVDAYKGVFESNFAEVGVGINSDRGMIKESQSHWKFFASGRRNCKACLVNVVTANRQDLIAVLMALATPEEDLVTLEIPMDDNAVDSFVFTICNKKQAKAIQAENADMKDYAVTVSSDKLPKDFPSDLVLLTDCREIISEILTTKTLQILKEGSKYISQIHITDQRPDIKNETVVMEEVLVAPKSLRVSLKLPSPENMHAIAPLMDLAMSLIDTIPKVTLSKQAKDKASSLRLAVAKKRFRAQHEERQELVQAKKDEKIRLKMEEYEKLTPAQKVKRDAKDAKKKAKVAAMPRMKVKMM